MYRGHLCINKEKNNITNLIFSYMAKVKNMTGPDRFHNPPSEYDSWLDYWEKKTGKKASTCGATDCSTTKGIVGGHVVMVGSTDTTHYITPLCRPCNNRADTFYVSSELIPVPE
jgi:hypothetical protein